MCDKFFTDFGSFSVHTTVIHSYNKTFHCDMCNKPFGILTLHITAIHSYIKYFQCDMCYKLFTEQSNLNVHVSLSHSKNRTF